MIKADVHRWTGEPAHRYQTEFICIITVHIL